MKLIVEVDEDAITDNPERRALLRTAGARLQLQTADFQNDWVAEAMVLNWGQTKEEKNHAEEM